MKYRAKEDIPPNVKAGEIVEVEGELIPEFKGVLEPVVAGNDEDEDEGDGKIETIVNPDRTDLKARAAQLGLDYAPNIPTSRLLELVQDAEKEAAAKAEAEGEDEE